jgi:hypothetical protein
VDQEYVYERIGFKRSFCAPLAVSADGAKVHGYGYDDAGGIV